MNAIKVVTGAGPVGWSVASALAEAGQNVRLLTRSGSGPDHPLIDRRRVDVGDPAQLRPAIEGADAVFHCIHGSKYRAETWLQELPGAEQVVLAAAGEMGAVVVFPESLYSYSAPENLMKETSPREATGGKRGVRTQLLAARDASVTPTVSVVASDFFGPQVRNAYAGERMVPPILAGKTVRVLGSADMPHSFTYVPDLAAAMIAASTTASAWNTVLHAPTGPALSQRALAAAFASAADLPEPKIGTVPGWVIETAGMFSKDMRELTETAYQLREPFVMDSAASEELLHLAPTALDIAAKETVNWWRDQA